MKLKSAEEIYEQLGYCHSGHRYIPSVDWIRAIQADALRSGAADIKAEKNMQFPKKHAAWNQSCDDHAYTLIKKAQQLEKL